MPDENAVEQPTPLAEQPSEPHKIEAIMDDWYMRYIHPHILQMDAGAVAKIKSASEALKQKLKLIF